MNGEPEEQKTSNSSKTKRIFSDWLSALQHLHFSVNDTWLIQEQTNPTTCFNKKHFRSTFFTL